jgi:hypothetical protein
MNRKEKNDVANTIRNLPFGHGFYNPFLVKLRIVYFDFTGIPYFYLI